MPPRSNTTESPVPVNLGPRSYEVQVVNGRVLEFGSFVRKTLSGRWSGTSCRSALLVTDEHLAALALAAPYQAELSGVGIDVAVAVVPAGEESKSLDQASRLYDMLVGARADRHTLIVALGGGVIGDLAGFVAATFARGLSLIMVPTTLLAQVDSSVGGKVGINHPSAKNIIGAFHQPAGVWIDLQTLGSLPDRELRCGLAEVVKYGMILDGAFFASLEREVDAIMSRDPGALTRIVVTSCRLKADIVTRDEREETGVRAVLNFGHTVGHAIESVAGYNGLYRHGEAVAVGMVAEARIAERLGWISADAVDRLSRLLARFGLPTSAPGLDGDRLIAAMTRDKKNRDGQIRFVLPRSIGQVELTDAAGLDDVRAVVATL
jgi:3-dehydroquinate synthase